jgi:hypothetical protein
MFEFFLIRGLPDELTEPLHRRLPVRHPPLSMSVMARGASN